MFPVSHSIVTSNALDWRPSINRLRGCLIKYWTRAVERNYKGFKCHGPETQVHGCRRDIVMGWRCTVGGGHGCRTCLTRMVEMSLEWSRSGSEKPKLARSLERCQQRSGFVRITKHTSKDVIHQVHEAYIEGNMLSFMDRRQSSQNPHPSTLPY